MESKIVASISESLETDIQHLPSQLRRPECGANSILLLGAQIGVFLMDDRAEHLLFLM